MTAQRTHQQLLYEISGLLVEAIGEFILERFDLLPSEELAQAMERKPARYHLVYNASECPEIGAVAQFVR